MIVNRFHAANKTIELYFRQRGTLDKFMTLIKPDTLTLLSDARMVATKNGAQIPELQKSMLICWAEKAAAAGFDVDGARVETTLGGALVLHQGQAGWNYESE